MRVAIVSTSYPLRDGQPAGHFVASEARALCRAGHDVTVVAPGPRASAEGASPRVLRVPGRGLFGPPGVAARIRENPLRGVGAVEFALGARRLLRREGPFALLIAHWLLPCAWPIGVGAAERLEGVAHGSDVRLIARLPRWMRQHFAGALLESATTVRCASASLREQLIGATTERLRPLTRVEPVPLELRLERPTGDIRQELGLAREQLVVVVARLVPEKRVAVALRAVARLPGVRVAVLGGGPERPSLEREFPAVIFTGELAHAEALSWIAAADVLVSASLLEGAPTAVREARALGVPVVARGSGDLLSESVRDAGLWLVPE